MASSSSPVNSTPQAAPTAAKKSFIRRILPALVVANIAVGVYVFLRTSNKEPNEKHHKDGGAATEEAPSGPAAIANITVPEQTKPVETAEPIKARPPIPEQEQRELYKWILEEKRKVKPQSPSEKKKIDEEKALLKELIRAKSIPSL